MFAQLKSLHLIEICSLFSKTTNDKKQLFLHKKLSAKRQKYRFLEHITKVELLDIILLEMKMLFTWKILKLILPEQIAHQSFELSMLKISN